MSSDTSVSGKRFFAVTLLLNLYKRLHQLFGTKGLVIMGAICGLILKFRVRKHKINPAPLYTPIIGHVRFIKKHFTAAVEAGGSDFLDVQTQIFKDLGRDKAIFTVQLPTVTQVFVADPQIIDSVFRLRFSDANKSESAFGPLKVLLGEGIFASNGAVWKKQRQIASHMFTLRSLKDYMFGIFCSSTDNLLDKFDELKNDKVLVINFYDMWNRLTFEAFTKIAFGVDVQAIVSAPEQCEFAYRFDRVLQLTVNRTFSAINWKLKKRFQFIPFVCPYEVEIDEHAQWLETFVLNIIENRKKYFKEISKSKIGKNSRKTKQKYDLLSMFMADNDKISDKELRDVAFNFIIAGKDTTAQTLSWLMYVLFEYNGGLKEIEIKIRNEIKRVFGEKQYEENQIDITFKKIAMCNYIEWCLKETLRLYPSVPHLVRTALKDIDTYNGYTIKKGDDIFAACYAMGRLPWIWDKPDEFIPERFADAKNQPDPSKYPSFNIAPRLCLGKHVALMEAKIAIVKLFSKYKNIKTVENQNIKWTPSPTMQMSEGFKAYLS